MSTILPDKLYYKIGEVAEAAKVKTSVLRFWESEFVFLKPDKSTSGQRLYTKREVDLILKVRHLLYEEKFTIEGVKKRISSKGMLIKSEERDNVVSAGDVSGLLDQLRHELKEIRNML
ncbi:MAG: MerR family transcriptional regulator [Geobacter sp.]|nr:MerR family transcriptional regulator [Geobacter sp.]